MMENYGLSYMKGGVILVGFIYLIITIVLHYYPKLLKSIPEYIFNIAVLFISLLLIPIGFNMMNEPLGYMSILLIVMLYMNNKTQSYAMPITLLVMSVYSYYSGNMVFNTFKGQNIAEWIKTVPKFNLYAFSTISTVALASMGELLGDVSKTAQINNIKLGEDLKWKRVFLGNGIANVFAGFIGSNPSTSYTENNGFLLSVGHDDLDPTAQVYTAILFILLALITPLIGFLQSIPLPVFGALLTFLFVNLGIDSIQTIKWNKKRIVVCITALVGFTYTYKFIPSISPITVSFVLSILADKAINIKEE